MRKEIITCASVFILGTCIVFAQEIPQKEVPQPIQVHFNQKFAQANHVEWEKEGPYFKVEFELNNDQDYDAWYSQDGHLIKYKAEVAQKDIPAAILKAVKNNYPGYHIDDVEKTVEKGIATYKVEIEKADKEQELFFTEAGKELNFAD